MPVTQKFLDRGQITALERADHSDPYAVLGPHKYKKGNKEGIVIRALQPNAESIKIWLENGTSYKEMTKISDGGVFECLIEGLDEAPAYYYEVIVFTTGNKYTTCDPYTRSANAEDFDLQLWGEGNHRRAYEWMGAHIMKIGE
jgi:1,4-alpha-glucan branching enzyme